MNKKRLSYIFSGSLMLLLLSGLSVWASLTPSQKGAIMESFKDRQYNLLFESELGNIDSEDADIFNISRKINLFGNIQEGLLEQQNELQTKSSQSLLRILSLEDSIEDLEKEIEVSGRFVNKINDNIITMKVDIDSSEKTIEVLRKRINENKKILLKYLIYIYKKSNNVYGEDDVDNIKAILLNNDTIGDVLNDLYFKGLIEVAGKKLVDKHRTFVSELYMKKLDLEEKQSNYKALRKKLVIETKVLKDKMDFKQKVLTISKGKQVLYEKYIRDKINVEKSVQEKLFREKIKFNSVKTNLLKKYNCEYIDIATQEGVLSNMTQDCIDLNKVIFAESRLKGFGIDGQNKLAWPINPSYGISSFYKDSEYKVLFGNDHDAIDVVAPQSTPIHAPADGYVLYVEPPVSSDYSYLAIKHSDGFVTVYGHLSSVDVAQYDFVKKGEVFAKTGGKFGTLGAGLMTTGPHLHMEVFKDKNSIDPFEILNLADLSFKRLPEKYKYKFYKDFKEKKGYEYQEKRQERSGVFYLEGASEVERQKSLIDKYAVGGFRDWEMWVGEALDGNIDPAFLMCIGLAETGLGKHMKTPNNVGNIGNTDSGATKTFPSPSSGVYWMVKTLNNKYLGEYTQINQLSRYGNKDGPIYASSSDNWHNNLVKCLSTIKGIYIPDNYTFRIFQ